MQKPQNKVITSDEFIDRAEKSLQIKYPEIIRKKLKEQNGFYWDYFRFFCVLDDDDKYHTFDDVVRENENQSTGWKLFLPENQVAIANEDHVCLTLNTNQDGNIYIYDNEIGSLEIFAKSDEELEQKLSQKDE